MCVLSAAGTYVGYKWPLAPGNHQNAQNSSHALNSQILYVSNIQKGLVCWWYTVAMLNSNFFQNRNSNPKKSIKTRTRFLLYPIAWPGGVNERLAVWWRELRDVRKGRVAVTEHPAACRRRRRDGPAVTCDDVVAASKWGDCDGPGRWRWADAAGEERQTWRPGYMWLLTDAITDSAITQVKWPWLMQSASRPFYLTIVRRLT